MRRHTPHTTPRLRFRDHFTGESTCGRIFGMQSPDLMVWHGDDAPAEAVDERFSCIAQRVGELVELPALEWAERAETEAPDALTASAAPLSFDDIDETMAGEVVLTAEHGHTARRYYELTGDAEALAYYRAIFRLIDRHNNDEPTEAAGRPAWTVALTDSLRTQQSSTPGIAE